MTRWLMIPNGISPWETVTIIDRNFCCFWRTICIGLQMLSDGSRKRRYRVRFRWGLESRPTQARDARTMKKSRVIAFSQLLPGVRSQLEKLKSGLVLMAAKKKVRTILFLSYNEGEGTTTVATNFARTMAEDNIYRTLLVHANTRSPFSLTDRNGDGDNGVCTFSDLFKGQGEKNLAVPKPDGQSGLSIISSGTPTYHPSQVFDHARFAKFIDEAKKRFHFVLFDSSPIGRYYDSVVLGSHVDGVILIIEAERTQLHELRWAKQMLQDRDIPILGAVLNRRKFRIPTFVFEKFFR